MSSKKNVPAIDPLLQARLVAAFGAKSMQSQTMLLRAIQPYYRHIPGNNIDGKESAMTPTEYSILLILMPSWWSGGTEEPWLTISEIAGYLKKSERQVQRHLASLKAKGFLLIEEQYAQNDGGQLANRYDFTPFFQRMLDVLEQKGGSHE